MRKLFKGGNYSRAETIRGNTVAIFLEVKFIYSEKATAFCEIFVLLLTACTALTVKSKISQHFVAFSEYMNFKTKLLCIFSCCAVSMHTH